MANWLADPAVPAEVKSAFETARNIEARERANIINAMTAHVTDPTQKKALVDNLATETLAKLQTLQLLTPQSPQQQRDPVYNWLGAVGGGASGQNLTDNSDKDDILEIPVANYGSKKADADIDDLMV